MIESRNNVPKVYSRSRDYQGLLKLLDIITCSIKSDIDNYKDLIDPDRCPDKYLPLLASYVGYEYDNNIPPKSNRLIIKYYPYLIRLRGSDSGIKLAVALAINSCAMKDSIIISMLETFDINYVLEDNRIDVYIDYIEYIPKLIDLIEVVRPVGTTVRIINSVIIRHSDKVQISDRFDKEIFSYKDNGVRVITYREEITNSNDNNQNKVGFGQIAEEVNNEESDN